MCVYVCVVVCVVVCLCVCACVCVRAMVLFFREHHSRFGGCWNNFMIIIILIAFMYVYTFNDSVHLRSTATSLYGSPEKRKLVTKSLSRSKESKDSSP